MKAREFSFIFVFLAYRAHVINVDWTNTKTQSWTAFYNYSHPAANCHSSAIHSPISILVSPLRLSSHCYLCHLAAILTLCAGEKQIPEEPLSSSVLLLDSMLAQDYQTNLGRIHLEGRSASLQSSWIERTFIWATSLKNFQSKHRKVLELHFSSEADPEPAKKK